MKNALRRLCSLWYYLRGFIKHSTRHPMPINLAITNEEKILVTLNPVTAAGNPATLDGEPTWTVTEGDATLDVQPGGLSVYIVSGSVGASTVTVSADADLDEGEVRELSDVIAVNVTGAEAGSLGLTIGTGEPK